MRGHWTIQSGKRHDFLVDLSDVVFKGDLQSNGGVGPFLEDAEHATGGHGAHGLPVMISFAKSSTKAP